MYKRNSNKNNNNSNKNELRGEKHRKERNLDLNKKLVK